ncbi:MAG: TIGR03084 family metal-binding protein [Ilumatobacteraceae bacterium]
MAVLIPDLCLDLEAETAVLTAQLAPLGRHGTHGDGWSTSTPADGWTVKDQVVHLAFFDQAVTTALTDPERFRGEVAAAMAGSTDFVGAVTEAYSGRTGAEVMAWFTTARAAMMEAFVHADLSVRVPWYGPEMSVASALTARIMETWAHGQDIFDALGTRHPPTAAMRQVAHIGVRALPNSFVSHGREVPADPVRLEIVGPDGAEWIWGPDDAANRICGIAEEFCLVVTQRRHVADTGLVIVGDVATEWLSIAQAFAGPPGTGRRPGQFARPD